MGAERSPVDDGQQPMPGPEEGLNPADHHQMAQVVRRRKRLGRNQRTSWHTDKAVPSQSP
jgi:hypothetical protein